MRAFALLFVMLLNSSAFAGLERSDTKQSLRGLGGVWVISQLVDVQPEGLSTNDIQKMVEGAVRDAGIKVDSEPQSVHGDANLSITVNTVKDPQLGAYLFMVQVAVIQRVHLTRQTHGQPVAAQTWTRNVQGLTTPDRVDIIAQAVKQCVSAFIDDYWKVNERPKK